MDVPPDDVPAHGDGFLGKVEPALRACLSALALGCCVWIASGGPITHEGFLHAGRLSASHLDYDVPFILVVMVMVFSPICVGMRMPGTLPGGGPPTAPEP